jgi:hypothetical protein
MNYYGGRSVAAEPISMRYIYLDEAGTSAKEPVSVVAGVIVHPDDQWRIVHQEMERLFDEYVPAKLRDGFIFHAADIFNGGRFRDEWFGDSRWKLLTEFSSIPRRFGLPICYSMCRRDSMSKEVYESVSSRPLQLAAHEFDHLLAFSDCAASADKYMRTNTPEHEVATLIVENVDRMRRYLKTSLDLLRRQTMRLLPEHIRHDVSDITTDKIQTGVEIRVSRIIDCVHFAAKRDAPLLQLADAAAFVIRRWVTNGSRGDELMNALLRLRPRIDDFSGPSSFGTWVVRQRS